MIDIKALFADREAGTQGIFSICTNQHELHSVISNKTLETIAGEIESIADARRFARVPDLEQALIDARAEIEQLQNDIIDMRDNTRRDCERALWERGLGECDDRTNSQS